MAKNEEKKKEGLGEMVKTLVYALLLAGIIRTLFFQPFWIPSGSMKDTLLIGDFLFVNKMAYGYSKHSCPWSMCPFSGRIFGSEPERGDVVVFKHPTTKVDFIKRLTGLPGDRVQMKKGELFINGTQVPVAPDGLFTEVNEIQGPMQQSRPRCSNNPVAINGICEKQKSIATLPNGVSHSVLNVRDGDGLDDTGIFTVPEGQYFFMGDNRDNSSDSRALRPRGVGFVPFDHLVGRADRIIFSSAGRSILAFWTWRSDRYFKAVE
jgi:signal peptidase I